MKPTLATVLRAAGLAALCAFGASSRAAIRDVPGTYLTVTDAVNSATPGDTIVSSPGTYPTTAGLTVAKNLTFAGPANGRVVISAPAGNRVLAIGSGVAVSFDHLTISGGALTAATDRGAGLLNGGSATLTSCTLSGNSAGASGGAIYNTGGATLSMTNCTIANNSVSGGSTVGGAAISNGGTVTLLNCTITGNTSAGVAGGLDNRNNNSFTLKNTLVAGNTGGANPDAAGSFVSQDYNLVGNGTGVTFTGTSTHNKVGTAGSPINALLGPLQDNGGATYTVALLPTSPAIDAIPGSAPSNFPATDERDTARPLDGGDGDNIPEADIGAYEATAPIQFYVATTGSDGNTGVSADQPLRNINTAINRSGVSGVINVAPGTYTENLVLQKSVTLQGTLGSGPGTIIQSVTGVNQDTTLIVYPDVTLNISDLTIANGYAQNDGFGVGGGVFSEGTVTMRRCIVTGNTAAFTGGGVVNYTNATMTLIDTTISGNGADQAGGVENDGTLTMTNCTVSGNSAGSGAGGGIGNTDTLTMINCTVANNTAGQGGGIYASNGTATLFNVTISGNMAGDGGGIGNLVSGGLYASNTVVAGNTATTGPDISGAFASQYGYNFVGNNKDATLTTTSTDIVGTNTAPRTANLGALANNGGYTQTLNPNPGSPLIDAGPNTPFASPPAGAGYTATDQRGIPRPIGARSDIGAVEYQPTFTVTNTNDDGNTGSLRWAMGQANSAGNAVVRFAIAPTGAGGGVKTITLAAANGALPYLGSNIVIDGWSQGGANYTGKPLIEINGQNSSGGGGIVITGNGDTVRGLCINRFANNTGGNGFGVLLGGNVTGTWVYGCYIGTDPTGTIARPNGQMGLYITSNVNNNLIGTNFDGVNDAAEANVISGNSRSGVESSGGGGSNNVIAGNFIGTTFDGSAALPNGEAGVRLLQGTGNRVTRNAIAFNTLLGIDLAPDGVTANDLGDDDGGPNSLQNFPVISGLATANGTTTISGTLNSAPVSNFTLEFFASDVNDPSGYGEGQRYLATTTVQTDGSGNAPFSVPVSALSSGQWVTATATDANGNTSEFSQAVVITGPPVSTSGVASNVSTTSATLNASVSAGGLATTVQFQINTGGGFTNVGSAINIGTSAAMPSIIAQHLPAGTLVTYRAVATNSAGTTNGTGSTFTTLVPASGTALSFDGTGGVRIPNFGTYAPTDEITIEFWQKVTSVKQQSVFVLSPDDTSNRINAHTPWVDGTVYWDFGSAGGTGRLAYSPPVSLVGTWQHFAFVSSASGNYQRIYRNGVLEASKVGHGTFFRTPCDLIIGGNGYAGLVDEFRVWNVARTQAQVQSTMNTRITGSEANLLDCYHFDEGAGSAVVDSGPQAVNGSVTGALWTPSNAFDYRTPVAGAALSFDGVNDYVQVNSGAYFNGDFTIEAWVYPRAFNPWSRILDFGNGQSNNNIVLALSNSNTGKPDLTIINGANSGDVFTPNPIPLNQWTHIAATLSGTTATMYVNGNAVATKTLLVPANVTRTQNFIARSNWAGDPYANAVYDEVRIWNTARTAAQIQSLLYRTALGQAGLVAEFSMDEGAGPALNDANGGNSIGYLVNGPAWVASTAPIGPTYTATDAARALKIAGGLIVAGASDARLNVETASAAINLSDALRIARRAAGLDANP